MSYQVLARKYRPQKFSEVIGQEHVTRTLKNAIEQGRTAHGYIFSGHRGIGKTTVARILAMAPELPLFGQAGSEPCGICDSCTEIRAGNAVDVIEIDAATNRGIDEIRELREAARYRPSPRPLQDLHSRRSAPDYGCGVQCAAEDSRRAARPRSLHAGHHAAGRHSADHPLALPAFQFSRRAALRRSCNNSRTLSGRENIEADDDALALLAEAGDGSMRDALSILDQAIASSTAASPPKQVRQLVGIAPSDVLEEVMQAVAQGSSETVLRLVDKLISEGHSPTHFARQMVRFLRNAVVVAKVAGADSSLLQISSDERQRVAA
jgi:DNA polymerase-3 subunit gamma/tau